VKLASSKICAADHIFTGGSHYSNSRYSDNWYADKCIV